MLKLFITLLLQQVHVKQNGMSLLYVAAVNGRVNVTKLLLEHKADMTALVNTWIIVLVVIDVFFSPLL